MKKTIIAITAAEFLAATRRSHAAAGEACR